jgi:hypothetical protein
MRICLVNVHRLFSVSVTHQITLAMKQCPLAPYNNFQAKIIVITEPDYLLVVSLYISYADLSHSGVLLMQLR